MYEVTPEASLVVVPVVGENTPKPKDPKLAIADNGEFDIVDVVDIYRVL